MQPPANGTDERLDVVIAQQGEILAELRALRGSSPPERPSASAEDGLVELREPRDDGAQSGRRGRRR